MTNKSKKVSKSYKYFIIFLCMFTQAIPFGIAQNIQPLFIHPLINTFHFTLASYTLLFTLGAVTSSICSPIVGNFMGKINFKLMYIIGIIISSIAFVIFGFSSKLPEFYIAGILCMTGAVFYSTQGVPWVINHWFSGKNRGVALGIAFCGGSIGNIFLQPFTQSLLRRYMVGNAKTGHLISMTPFFIFAIILFIVGLIIAFFIRLPKEDEIVISNKKNLQLDRNSQKQGVSKKGFEGWTPQQVLKMSWFWVFSIGFLMIGLGLASITEEYAAFLDTKMTFTAVGIVGSVFGISSLIGNITGGMLFDKLGIAKSMTYAAIMYVIAILMMIFISGQTFNSQASHWEAIIFAICIGLAVFCYMSGPAFMAKSLFGKKDQGVMLGYVGLSYAIGFAIGTPLFGIIKGIVGFKITWYIMLTFVIIGFILLIFAVIKIENLQKICIQE